MKQKNWNLRNLEQQVRAYEPAAPTKENILARNAVARIIFRVPFDETSERERVAKSRKRMEREAMVLIASSSLFRGTLSVAEREINRFLHEKNDEIWQYAREVCTTGDEGESFVRWLCLRTRNILEKNSETWQKVPAVEEALIEHGDAITEQAIRKILKCE